MTSRMKWWALVLGLIGSACSADAESGGGDAADRQTCAEASQCMVDECSDELDDLQLCLDVTMDTRQCDQQNLAVGNCTGDCRDPELSPEERDASFALFLCEVDDDRDECDEESAACDG